MQSSSHVTIILGYNNSTDWTHLEQLTYVGHVLLATAALAATSYSSSHSSRVIGSFSTIGSSKANIMQDSTLSAAVPIPPAAPNGLDQAQFEADKRAVYK